MKGKDRSNYLYFFFLIITAINLVVGVFFLHKFVGFSMVKSILLYVGIIIFLFLLLSNTGFIYLLLTGGIVFFYFSEVEKFTFGKSLIYSVAIFLLLYIFVIFPLSHLVELEKLVEEKSEESKRAEGE